MNCVCGRPAPDAFLCKSCSMRLGRALGDLPALIADLDITLARQAVIGAHSPDGGKPPKKDAQPLPFHKKAGDVRADLRHTLVTAVRHLTEARGITEGPEDNAPAMARWLLRYSDSIRLDPAGPDIATAIHDITHRIVDVIDLPRTRGRFKVGDCVEPETVEHTADGRIVVTAYCPGEIWVHLPAEDLGQRATVECRACHKVYEPWQWDRLGKRILKRGAA